MGYNQYNELVAPDLIQFAWNHRDVVMIFKFHPIQPLPAVDHAMLTLKHCPAIKIVVKDDVYPLLAAADGCVLVGNSTTGIEALAFGKPLVEIPIKEQEYTYAEVVPQALTFGEAAQLVYGAIESGTELRGAVSRVEFLSR